MTKQEAIEVARQGYREYPEFFERLRPRLNRITGQWQIEVWVTPMIFCLCIDSIEALRTWTQRMIEAGQLFAKWRSECRALTECQ